MCICDVCVCIYVCSVSVCVSICVYLWEGCQWGKLKVLIVCLFGVYLLTCFLDFVYFGKCLSLLMGTQWFDQAGQPVSPREPPLSLPICGISTFHYTQLSKPRFWGPNSGLRVPSSFSTIYICVLNCSFLLLIK